MSILKKFNDELFKNVISNPTETPLFKTFFKSSPTKMFPFKISS
mgnify:CR=1 FL=1